MLTVSARKPRLVPFLGTLIWFSMVCGGPLPEIGAADTTDEIASQWLEIADAVLARHVDPPTRQEMLKTAIQAIYKLARQDPPPGLAKEISQLGSNDELLAFLRTNLVVVMAENQPASSQVRDAGIRGLLTRVAGVEGLIPLSEFHVQQQLRDNRYVGIGIQLGMKGEYPTMITVFRRGPAWQAGGRDGDRMISIDGMDAKGMPLRRVIELLRGQEGKPTTVVVRRVGSKKTQPLNMVRGLVPFDTVLGTDRDEEQNWRYKINDDPRIAYLKIESFRGSTPSELRRIAGQLHADDCRALVLDLRGTEPGEMRYVVMIADALLGEGVIGHVLGVRGRQQFDSTADQLFPGWPMAVLVDRNTAGQAEWIAAALKDSRRATLLGTPTAGQGAIVELVELPNGIGGVRLTTGILFRRNGRPITVAGQSIIVQPGNIHRLARDAEGAFLRAQKLRRKGISPDREITADQIAEAVKLLQGKLKATTTAMR